MKDFERELTGVSGSKKRSLSQKHILALFEMMHGSRLSSGYCR